jgi:hypothetical protein
MRAALHHARRGRDWDLVTIRDGKNQDEMPCWLSNMSWLAARPRPDWTGAYERGR